MTTPSWKDRVVLVTGGLGFLGSALVTALVERGARVRVLDSLLPQFGGNPRHLNGVVKQVSVVIEDTRSRDAVNSSVDGADVVYHLAAPTGPGSTSGDYITDLDVACLGTWHILEAMRVHAPRARLVFGSSHYVYSPEAAAPVREDAPTDPSTLFGAHQLAAEKYLGTYRRAYGMDLVSARLTSVFGPRQRLQNGWYGTVARALDAALRDEDLPIHGDGSQSQDYLHASHAVEALLALGSVPSCPATLNVGSGASLSIRAMSEAVISAVGRGRLRMVSGENPESATLGHFVADVSRLRALGVRQSAQTFEHALRDTIDWYQSRSVAL